ncbi:MAG: translation initiation factor IF-2 [Bacilli bacterium]|nr:translation initiation factor IF-2 [Bacilli bacterium]
MKVKELSEIFNVSIDELLDLLENVGVNIASREETMVNKDLEKKLAKRYNVEYPFKVGKQPKKSKPTNSVVIPGKPAKNAAPAKVESTPVKKEEAKPAPKPVEEVKPVKIEEPVRVMKTLKTEEVKPRVDEATLTKYAEYLEDDEYNVRRETRTKNKNNSEDYGNADNRRRKKNIKNKNVNKAEKRTSNIPAKKQDEKGVIYYEAGMTVQEVAEAMNVGVTELVKKLFMSIGVMAGATNSLERDIIELIAIDYNFEVKDKEITDMTRFDEMNIVDDPADLVERPVIVTIMGHVDHGKTTLLDTIRSSHVTKGEAGGITQHIGAYQVEKNGSTITFIDTPGHAAFTEMRARGAQITDIVILVVASDDGVMPQTKEAIEHAQAANVPIIVAINKMDKPTANPDRIKQELTEYNLLAEEWGGDTIFVPISALNGQGVDELLEMVVLVSELREYKANPNRLGVGTVIEAKLDKGRGPVATLLVQNGTVKVGDIIVVGNTFGKIRAMQDEKGKQLTSAGPSKPVEITGIAEVPCAGDKFMILDDERKAREISETRTRNRFNEEMGVGKGVSLNDLLKNQSDEELKVLNLIIKCDVQGSIEAIKGLLEKINIEGTKINIISSRVGGITETDINLAIASQAVIIGFNIRPMANISDLAKSKGIEIRLYNIIYKLQEDIEKAVKGLLDPVFEEKETGQAVVRETYKVSKVGTIAGCYVTSGYVSRNAGVRVIRNSIVIYTGKVSSLKRFKDDAKEVKAGFDCGLTIEHFNDIKVDDIIECFVMEEVERD